MNTTTITSTETSTDLLAISTILGGLLASGHFTTKADEDDNGGLIRSDMGKDWKKDQAGDPSIYCRRAPEAWFAALELFEAAKDYCSADKSKL
jgi:hypothetical protein